MDIENQPGATTPTDAVVAPIQRERAVVTFTPEQQAKVDEIVRNAMGRAGGEARNRATELERQTAQLESELEKLRSASPQTDIERLHHEHKKAMEAAAQKQHEADELRNQLQTFRKEQAITRAAERFGFHDSAAIAELTNKFVEFDPQYNRYVVKDEHGSPRLNNRLEPMSLDDFYQDYAANHPWTVRAEVRPGIGSTPSSTTTNGEDIPLEKLFGPGSDSALANKIAQRDIKLYRRLKQDARARGLVS